MTTRDGDPNARREFLKFLAASPYVAALGYRPPGQAAYSSLVPPNPVSQPSAVV
jgi:hypothetical protein